MEIPSGHFPTEASRKSVARRRSRKDARVVAAHDSIKHLPIRYGNLKCLITSTSTQPFFCLSLPIWSYTSPLLNRTVRCLQGPDHYPLPAPQTPTPKPGRLRLLLCTFLVISMQLGFAMLEAGVSTAELRARVSREGLSGLAR